MPLVFMTRGERIARSWEFYPGAPQLSTGPRTEPGKSAVRLNAVKTGLTGQTVVLPSDDIAAYEKFVAIIDSKFRPENAAETLIVQSIADTEWRLLRVPTLEAGFYALGRELAAECAAESNPQVRAAILEALALQERRLRNQLKELTAQLSQLQTDRDAVQFHRRNKEMSRFRSRDYKPPVDAPFFGFEFTEEYLDTRKEADCRGGIEALLQFDRSWKAQIGKKPS
jgi:hypothetical protein